MTSNTISGVKSTPSENRTTSSHKLPIYPLPPELLVRIQAALNPEEAIAFVQTHRGSDPFGAAVVRFEEKDVVTLEEIRYLLEVNPNFSRKEKRFALDLSGSKIGDAELKNIIEHFPNITAIYAKNCNRLTDAGIEHMSGLANLQILNVSGCKKITNIGLGHVSGLKNLERLEVSGCELITNKGIAHLSKLPRLSYLDLSHSRAINNLGINRLSDLKNLKTLILSGCTQIMNELRLSGGFAKLTHLDVSNCDQITEVNLSGLANLSSVDLSGCNAINALNLAGLKNLSTVELFGCVQIAKLNMEGCDQVDDVNLSTIVTYLRGLTTLNLARCTEITDAGLLSLTSLPLLKILNLAGCKITKAGDEQLGNFPMLTDLNLEESQINDEGLAWLTRNAPELADLNLAGCQEITEKGLEILRTMKTLTRINLDGCHQITTAGQKAMREWANANLIRYCVIKSFESKERVTLEELRHLRSLYPDITLPKTRFKLDLAGSDITDDELQSIIQHFPRIIEINAKNCLNLTDNGLQHLQALAFLENLNLSGCKQITEKGLEMCCPYLPNLLHLDLSQCDQILHLEAAQHLTSLKKLNLSGCVMITDAKLAPLSGLRHLASLDLVGCEISNDGIMVLLNGASGRNLIIFH